MIFGSVSKMNHFNLQQNAFAVGSEEMRGSVSISDLKGPIVCPKPRRVGVLANNPVRPLRWHKRYFFIIIIISSRFEGVVRVISV